MRNKKGFSLIELMIVLIIISLLLATVTVFASSSLAKSRAINVATNLKNISTAMLNSIYINYEVPENINDLGRDIDLNKYGVAYLENENGYNVTVFFSGEVDFTMTKLILSSVSKTAPDDFESYEFVPEGLNYEDIKDSEDVIYYNFLLSSGGIIETESNEKDNESSVERSKIEIINTFIAKAEEYYSIFGAYPEQNETAYNFMGLNFDDWKKGSVISWNGVDVEVKFEFKDENSFRIMIQDSNRFSVEGENLSKIIVYRFTTDEIGWHYKNYNGEQININEVEII